ncbi:LCP family protein [Dethiobacter alkaliphilus]|uniref:Cell envelope-related transcriptional attenuator n=1 Tax=Dethiobacter alkaliphilus AHT 1 TaxID=555088 RepID=C0GGR8_DETAL|nr:LCP family protein [Dethiobacter alkaliphilus]EEG77509.1 cell envelope-related transcriptional attenuator [Dethiobacter alkaliphilus AHT 1]
MTMLKKKILIIMAAVMVVALLAGAYPLYTAYRTYQVISDPPAEKEEVTQETETVEKEPAKLLTEPTYNLLVYGIDTGEWVNGTYRSGPARADTILLLQLNLEDNSASMLSIPRDTLVKIPGRGDDKINHAHAFGGAELLVETVESFVGVPVDYYLQVNYKLFSEIVDGMGGIEFDLDRTISARGMRLEPGPQVLDGDQAFAVVSFRRERMGDIGRVQRQQRFVGAVAREVRSSTPRQLLSILYSSWKHVKTNISMAEAAELITASRDIKESNVNQAMVPGWFYNRSGISYWRADDKETKALLEELFFQQTSGL